MNESTIILNINSEDIKLAEINQENGKSTAKRLYHSGAEKNPQEYQGGTTEVIKKFIGERPPGLLKAILVVSSQDLAYRDFFYPFNSKKKVAKAIDYEISSEFSPDEYVVDYIKSVAREPGKNAFLAAIAKKEMLLRHIKAAEDAGLKVVGITSDVSTLGNFFRHEDETFAMQMEDRQTLFALFIHGTPVLLRNIPIGISQVQKGSGSIDQGGIKPLISEIIRTIHSFTSKTGTNPGKTYISGNVLLHKEILGALGKKLGLDLIVQPPSGAKYDVIQVRDDLNIYASVLGAAGWKRNGFFFNFLKDDFIGQDRGTALSRSIRWGSIICGLFVFTYFLSSVLNVIALERRKSFLTSETRSVFQDAFPHTKRIVDEVKQAKNFLTAGSLPAGDENSYRKMSILSSLKIISRTIPKEINFEIKSLFQEKNKIEINGETDSFETANKIQELLSGSNDFSEITISNAKSKDEGQHVEFKITIRLKG